MLILLEETKLTKILKMFKDGIINNNPLLIKALGLCPALAVTTSAFNGLGMGVATTSVFLCSNLVISLCRAEAFASQNGSVISMFDGLVIGLGFTVGLTMAGIVREILGTMTIFGFVISDTLPQTIVMILPPGAFITLAFFDGVR